MIDKSSSKIRSDIVKRSFFDEDNSFFEDLSITKREYKDSLELYKYLIQLSDGYYYAKRVTELGLCNEIVGRYLCNKLDLETTPLEIILDKGKLKMASPNYKNKKYNYQLAKDDYSFCSRNLYEVDRLKILPSSFREEQLKLISIDLMMEQWDRSGSNMEEKIVNGYPHLSPVIDFVSSFNYVPFFDYYNPYVSLPKNVESIDKFISEFPYSYKYFIDMFNVCLDEIIDYIESNYPIKVSDRVKRKYSKVIDKNQKILRHIK